MENYATTAAMLVIVILKNAVIFVPGLMNTGPQRLKSECRKGTRNSKGINMCSEQSGQAIWFKYAEWNIDNSN
jgi:hypothetical protein